MEKCGTIRDVCVCAYVRVCARARVRVCVCVRMCVCVCVRVTSGGECRGGGGDGVVVVMGWDLERFLEIFFA